MEYRDEVIIGESLNLVKFALDIYKHAGIYISKNTEKELLDKLDRINRCHICHSLIQDEQNIYVLNDTYNLKALCPQCLQSIVTKQDHLQTCECCGGKSHKLFKHHWFDPNDYTKYEYKMVCHFCNPKLIGKNLWGEYNESDWMNEYGWYHILPNWELQKLYINDTKHYLKQLKKEYKFPILKPTVKLK